MTSKEARAKLDAILARMRADADEINDMHRAILPPLPIVPMKGSKPYRDAKEAIQALGGIADLIVSKVDRREYRELTKTTKRTMSLFRELTAKEEKEFRQWAHDMYTPGDPVNEVWHPILRDEIAKINANHKPQTTKRK